MKVFRVVTERDGLTVKAPGVAETELKRCEYRYAAASIDEVWAAVMLWLAPNRGSNLEETLLGIFEEHPEITILF